MLLYGEGVATSAVRQLILMVCGVIRIIADRLASGTGDIHLTIIIIALTGLCSST